MKYEDTMRSLKMSKKLEKSLEGDADEFSRLPDEIMLQIFNKLIDLKILCGCYLVSRRFSSIVLQVGAIAITAPLINPLPNNHVVGEFSPSMPALSLFTSNLYKFLIKFKGLKSLFIELPSSSQISVANRCLFKWKVNFGTRIESIMYLFPSSIRDKDGFIVDGDLDGEEDNEAMNYTIEQDSRISVYCMVDAMTWLTLLLDLVKSLQMLEMVSITDSGRRGRVSLSGEKLVEVKGLLHSAFSTDMDRVQMEVDRIQSPNIYCKAYIPVLKLPVSGYMMKGIYFGAMKINPENDDDDDDLINSNYGFEDEEEAVYTEAVMEILEKHRDAIHTSKHAPKQRRRSSIKFQEKIR